MFFFTPGDVFADTKGCYVILPTTLDQKPVILVSVYAPNWDADLQTPQSKKGDSVGVC